MTRLIFGPGSDTHGHSTTDAAICQALTGGFRAPGPCGKQGDSECGEFVAMARLDHACAAIAMTALLLLPTKACAQTAEALAAADRLIAVQDLDAIMKDMATNVAGTLPGASDAQKRAFITEMTAPTFLDRYKAFARISFAKHLTIEELNTLSDFYSKPIAISATKKMGATMADIMPFIQSEIPGMVARVMKTP